MIIAFYFDDARFLEMAALCTASARACMPGVRRVQLSTEGVPLADGMDELISVPGGGHFYQRRVRAHLAAPAGDVLFSDVDVLFKADVRQVFDADFDVALPEIEDPHHRYTGALTFTRSPALWRRLAAGLLCSASAKASVTEILQAVQAAVDTHPAPVLRLPHAVYERLPKGPQDACEGAAIVHYRGPRKQWMVGADGLELARLW